MARIDEIKGRKEIEIYDRTYNMLKEISDLIEYSIEDMIDDLVLEYVDEYYRDDVRRAKEQLEAEKGIHPEPMILFRY